MAGWERVMLLGANKREKAEMSRFVRHTQRIWGNSGRTTDSVLKISEMTQSCPSIISVMAPISNGILVEIG